jgi:hypothetical protein
MSNRVDAEGLDCPTSLTPLCKYILYITSALILFMIIFSIITSSRNAWKRLDELESYKKVIQQENNFKRMILSTRINETKFLRQIISETNHQDHLLYYYDQYWRTMSKSNMAIIMPYIASQVEKILINLSRWKEYKPFFNKTLTRTFRTPIDFIFYFNRKYNAEIEHKIRSHIIELGLDKYLGVISFMYAELSDLQDPYPLGTSHMFYRLIDNNTIREKYAYFFYMEPDSLPIRSGWMDVLHDITFSQTNPFWVQGSMYRGVVELAPSQRLHINGNAIYSTSDDYHEFLRAVLKYKFHVFDVDQYEYLKTYPNKHIAIAHKFIYTDYIMNMYHTHYNETILKRDNPNTYIIHGGWNDLTEEQHYNHTKTTKDIQKNSPVIMEGE